MMSQKELHNLIRSTNFDWTQNLQSVWIDDRYDLPDVHAGVLNEFKIKLAELKDVPIAGPSKLGWPIVGPGGAGKTHVLGNFRKLASEADCTFIMVDMTDVNNFWETVLAGFNTSLEQTYLNNNPQRYIVVAGLIRHFSNDKDLLKKLTAGLDGMHKANRDTVKRSLNDILSVLFSRYRGETTKFQDVIRALIVAGCDDFEIANIGQCWLQGMCIDDDAKAAIGFVRPSLKPSEIVSALSWLISLGSPTIIAFDQLDPIIRQLEYQAEQTDNENPTAIESEANRIISDISDGLSAMFDITKRSLCVLSCLESSYSAMKERGLKTAIDRYVAPTNLKPLATSELVNSLIDGRVNAAATKLNVTTPYSGWPVVNTDLKSLAYHTPREVLKLCGMHRLHCLQQGTFALLSVKGKPSQPASSTLPDTANLDQVYKDLLANCTLPETVRQTPETALLSEYIRSACSCLVRELQFPENITAIVDTQFTGGRKTKPLHGRIRLVFHDEREREEHYTVRVLQRKNARAFQNRLRQAMTHAGIGRNLGFRHLAIVRTYANPTGQITEQLCDSFQNSGGVFAIPTESDLRHLEAIHTILKQDHPDIDAWLSKNKPASKLSICKQSFAELLSRVVDKNQTSGKTEITQGPTTPTIQANIPTDPPEVSNKEYLSTVTSLDPEPITSITPTVLAIGKNSSKVEVTLPVEALARHSVVLAGAGSGKSVLLKRLVETAAIQGIPSIVVDGANDMAGLAEQWPQNPPELTETDALLANEYHTTVEPIIWTPGKQGGNPLGFEMVPDLSKIVNDRDEFESTITMLSGGIADMLKLGNKATDVSKRGILKHSLNYYTSNGLSGHKGYIELLTDLPANAQIGISKECKLAAELADSLRILTTTDPLLDATAAAFDPAILFGDDTQSEKTRISILNLNALLNAEDQQKFVNQLSTMLFTWIKQNPAPPNSRALRGLLIIDEAKDFIPSRTSTACKESLTRLTAQARKYKLGIVFATQNPREIENTIIGNCSTHFYGKANSPAAIETVQALVRDRNGNAADIARLKTGVFYLANSDYMSSPEKITTPLCLSHHRTMDASDIEGLARHSREILNRNSQDKAA